MEKKERTIKITIDKNGDLRCWNGPEFEALKEKIGKEDDRREIIRGRRDLCG